MRAQEPVIGADRLQSGERAMPGRLVQLWRLRLREILEPTSLGHPDRGGHTSTMNGVTTGAGRRGLALRRRRLHQQLGLLARQEDMTDLLAVVLTLPFVIHLTDGCNKCILILAVDCGLSFQFDGALVALPVRVVSLCAKHLFVVPAAPPPQQSGVRPVFSGPREQRVDLVTGHERAAFYCDARH